MARKPFVLAADDREYIRKRLLAGDSMSDIRTAMSDDGEAIIPMKVIREVRDEVFEPLEANPEAVKALANGVMLNPLDIIRYRRRPGRKPRMARPPKPLQIEMFPA